MDVSKYVPLFQTGIWAILIFSIFRYFKPDIERLRGEFAKRLDLGGSVKAGPIELGELKNDIKEIRNEVMDTKQVVRDEVKTINDRFNKLTQSSRDFLELKPLSETWHAINNIKSSLTRDPLSSEEIEKCLTSFDPNERLPGYLELQIRPRQEILETVLDCFYLEMFLARRTGFETRPMWQAVQTIRKIVEASTDLEQDRGNYAKTVIQETLNYLGTNTHLDKNGECKRDLRWLLDAL